MSDLPKFSNAANFSNPSWRLLCLSNGHGEDTIAVRILQELQQRSPALKIAALPIVGEGRAYTRLGIPLIGSVKTMPSGGFIYMDGRQLMRDVQGGLLQLALAQLGAIRGWTGRQEKSEVESRKSELSSLSTHSTTERHLVLAVGDIVPLLFAWLSGANYAFVGTAKSEYYVRDEAGILPRRSLFERLESCSGSVYLPWERWLMSHPRCQAVFLRDSLTTQILQKRSIPAFDLGNPMMDGLEPVKQLSSPAVPTEPSLTILLLPGSRPPEAYANWEQILIAVTGLTATFCDRQLLFLGAIAPGLNLEPLCQSLTNAAFQQAPLFKGAWGDLSNPPLPISDSNILTFKQKNASLILTQHAYNDCLHLAEVAIAMAGTATEQFVGLSKPAITFPGKGPQFTHAFAEAQSRHLGPSIILVENPNQVADAVQSLLNDSERLQLIAENGMKRMGKPGAAKRIAECLMKKFGHIGDT